MKKDEEMIVITKNYDPILCPATIRAAFPVTTALCSVSASSATFGAIDEIRGEQSVPERSPMKDHTNLTGQWVGNYYQHNRPHSITLELAQEGDRLTGAMRDVETDRETSVFEMTAEAGLPPGADEQIVAHLQQVFPEASEASIRYVTHLPPESAVEGWVRGTTSTVPRA